MPDNKAQFLRKLRAAACLVLVALYVLGLIAMMTFSFQGGLILWVISTLGGIGLLYWKHTMEKRAEEAAKAAESKAGSPSDPDADAGAQDVK